MSPGPALTQLHVWQLRDSPHDEQEVGAEPPVGVQEQQAQPPVPLVSALHAVLRGHVEAALLGQKPQLRTVARPGPEECAKG